MIIDEKVVMLPPPPYAASSSNGMAPPPFPSSSGATLTLTGLPSHILLHIIYFTFPQTSLPDQDKLERQRKTLCWLSTSLRLVDQMFYIATMHILRSTYIPVYDALVRPPHSSDPFPLELGFDSTTNPPPPPSPYGPVPPSPSSTSTSLSSLYYSSNQRSSLTTIQRETAVLDNFIALKVREDVWADDTELHLERDEAYKDLFYHAQPKARLEDLVRNYGVQDGVVTLGYSTTAKKSTSKVHLPTTSKFPASSSASKASPPPQPAHHFMGSSLLSSLGFKKSKSKGTPPSSIPTAPVTPQPITPVPFHLLSISLTPRQVGLVLHPSKRTIVTTERLSRDEKLEKVAKRLVRELRGWLEEGG